jgi:hypothetical protein
VRLRPSGNLPPNAGSVAVIDRAQRLSSTPFALFSVGPGRWALKASTVVVMGSNPVVDRIKERGCPDCGSHRVRAGMDERDDLVSLICDSCLNAWSVEVPPPT